MILTVVYSSANRWPLTWTTPQTAIFPPIGPAITIWLFLEPIGFPKPPGVTIQDWWSPGFIVTWMAIGPPSWTQTQGWTTAIVPLQLPETIRVLKATTLPAVSISMGVYLELRIQALTGLTFLSVINFPLGNRLEATVLADIFNMFNENNFDGLGSTLVGAGSFLTPTSAFNPREYQLGVTVSF